MKILVVSDIHGSKNAADLFNDVNRWIEPDVIFCLGDFLYNGPRNGVRPDYDPMYVCETLNRYKDKIIAVRGNCDADIDLELLEFPIKDYAIYEANGKRFVLYHGDQKSSMLAQKEIKDGDIIINGHFHKVKIENENEHLMLNPGSMSFPKDELNEPTYMEITEDFVRIYAKNNRKIMEKKVN